MRGGGGWGWGEGDGYDHATQTNPKSHYFRRFRLFMQHVQEDV